MYTKSIRVSDVENIKNISDIEKVVISIALSFLIKFEDLEKQLKDYVNESKYDDAKKVLNELNYWKWNGLLTEAQNNVMKYCSVVTLQMIVNQDKFENKYGFSDPILVPTKVLPKISSSTKINANDAKADIYKKLGATIIV